MKKRLLSFVLIVCLSLLLCAPAFAAEDAGIAPYSSSSTTNLAGLSLGGGSSSPFGCGTCNSGSSITTTLTTSATSSVRISISGAASDSRTLNGTYISWTYNVSTAGSYTDTIKNTGSSTVTFKATSTIYVYKT